MAIRIPIVSEFDDRGIQRATREFKSLETNGQKAQFAIQKAALPAAAALGGLAIAAGSAYKAFAEDSAAAEKLATTLNNVTGATDAQVAAVEEFISSTSRAAAVADDELRPALDSLVRGTGDITKAQDLLTLALDISAGTGKDLQSVTDALSKAYNGNYGALRKLDPALASLIKSGASTDEVFAALGSTFKDQASKQADTAAGRMKNFSIQMGELKESIGAAAAPLIEKLLPAFQRFADWMSNNTSLVVALGITIGGLSLAIVGLNSASTAWIALGKVVTFVNGILGTSFTTLWAATGIGIILAIVAAVVLLNEKFGFMDNVVAALKFVFEELWSYLTIAFDAIAVVVQKVVDIFQFGFKIAIELVTGYFNIWFTVVSKIIKGISDLFKDVASLVEGIFKSIIQSIVNLFVRAINVIIKMINFVIDAYNKLPFAPDIDRIKELKAPDLFANEKVMVTGPRLEEPIMTRGGITNINLTVQGSVSTEQDLVESIRKGLVNAQRNGSQLVYNNAL